MMKLEQMYDMREPFIEYDIESRHATTQADLDNIKKVEAEMELLHKKHSKEQFNLWQGLV